MSVKLRKRKNTNVNEGYQMGGASPIGMYSGGYNPQGNTVFNNPAPFSYEIIPLNTSLSQKGNSMPNEIVVCRGMRIKGIGIEDGKTHIGRVDTIVRDSDGYIKCVIILDENDRTFVKLDDENIYILK
jgi:hypothetical protein